jgi:hypothetical protein
MSALRCAPGFLRDGVTLCIVSAIEEVTIDFLRGDRLRRLLGYEEGREPDRDIVNSCGWENVANFRLRCRFINLLPIYKSYSRLYERDELIA